ncbi:MAG: DUF1153 domain-containing protein [Rhodospirillales bacterium]|nr:DUF1153 domain-containing protein [Rhodospirillales bacterium]
MQTEKTFDIRGRGRKRGPPLPPPNTVRWVKSRKAAVVHAVQDGRISREDACRRYGLSMEELQSWEELSGKFGDNALKATAIKLYRGDVPGLEETARTH